MINIKMYGLGGQGVVTAGKVFSSAISLYEGKYAITVPSYGHERRGAPVFTDIIVDDQPVMVNCFVYEPDIVVVLDETIISKNVDICQGISDDTTLILNCEDQDTVDRYKHLGFKKIIYVNATQIAVASIGVGIPNGAILGALAKTGIVSIESVESAIMDFFGKKAGEKNAKAARISYEQSEKL